VAVGMGQWLHKKKDVSKGKMLSIKNYPQNGIIKFKEYKE